MKSFRPALAGLSNQQNLALKGCLSSKYAAYVHHMSRSPGEHAEAVARRRIVTQPIEKRARLTFEDLGVPLPITKSLRAAFPNVQYPTEAQSSFIPALLDNKDVLLKGETGSGKKVFLVSSSRWSFGLMVALLTRTHTTAKSLEVNRTSNNLQFITSLVIVPHRDLAYQLMHWIKRIVDASEAVPSIASIVQVVVRDGGFHLTTGLPTLREQAPHILIGTPQALMDVYQTDPDALRLPHLSSVVVDEVDYMVKTLPRKDPQKSFYRSLAKASKKLLAHPGETRELLNIIYKNRIAMNENRSDESGLERFQRRENPESGSHIGAPQLILSSATLRTNLSNYLFAESGWLDKDNVVKVKMPAKTRQKSLKSLNVTQDGSRPEKTGVIHSVLVVSNKSIKNVPGAMSISNPNEEEDSQSMPETIIASSSSMDAGNIQVDPAMHEKYVKTESPFNPDQLEAIATAFALDVPSIALLVLPSSAPVQRAVYELRDMGVNAHGLSLLASDKENLYSEGNPTLLVSTYATTRGIDLPELSHVFILGILEGPNVNGRVIDAYLHVAGRVGRFGRDGKVVTVVEDDDENGKGKGGVSDASKMMRILEALEVRLVRFEHFD